MNDTTLILEQLGQLRQDVGELRALAVRVDALEDRANEADRARFAQYQAREAASATWRRDVAKLVVGALIGAALSIASSALSRSLAPPPASPNAPAAHAAK